MLLSRGPSQRRKGFLLAVELLLMLPIITALFRGMVEFSMMISSEARLAQASREGARTGAVGGSEDDVKEAVKTVLGTAQYDLATVDSSLGTSVGDPVVVMVQIDATKVVPDFLAYVGFSIQNQKLVGRTVMRKE